MLVAPKPQEELIMYLSASYGVISVVLMTERDTVQTPVHFVSRALHTPELNYTPMEKLVLELVCAAKRLRRYFQSHPIVVITDLPINQILADFLVEKLDDVPPEASVIETPQEPWTLFTDGSSCVDRSGLILTNPEGTEFTYALSMHAGPRSVVAKAMRLGYYWPTMHRDARDMIRTCNACQWMEAKVVATITGGQVKKFVWDNIVCRFGLPGEIVSDNGKQFSYNPFKDWCKKLNITQCFASVKYLQSNRLVERENRSLGEGIKARLGEGNKNWIKELPHVFWAHRIMIKSSHDDIPFSLTYGTEAVIPAEIRMPTYRTAVVDVVHNNKELRLNLDLLEERRECAAIREAKAKLKMTKYYNSWVRGVTFRPGDFVYRSNKASHAMDGGKLGPKWEGPYEVTEALGDEAYRLRFMDGVVLLRTWNVANLKKCYL
nr:reverse transcriptase domain-containing protein [Tanacetum cinerariifolium]